MGSAALISRDNPHSSRLTQVYPGEESLRPQDPPNWDPFARAMWNPPCSTSHPLASFSQERMPHKVSSKPGRVAKSSMPSKPRRESKENVQTGSKGVRKALSGGSLSHCQDGRFLVCKNNRAQYIPKLIWATHPETR